MENNQTDNSQVATPAATPEPTPVAPVTPSPSVDDIKAEAKKAAEEAVKEAREKIDQLSKENQDLKTFKQTLANAFAPKRNPDELNPLALHLLSDTETVLGEYGRKIQESAIEEALARVRAEKNDEYEKAQAITQVLGPRVDIAKDQEAMKLISFYYNEVPEGSAKEKLQSALEKYDNFLRKKGLNPEAELQRVASLDTSNSSGGDPIAASAFGSASELEERRAAYDKKWGRGS